MRRDEVHNKLSMIASDEIVASHVSLKLFKIRDNICHYSPEIGSREMMAEALWALSRNEIISARIRNVLYEIAESVIADDFGDCETKCCGRCEHCEHFKG